MADSEALQGAAEASAGALPAVAKTSSRWPQAAGAILALAVVASYHESLAMLGVRWWNEPEYNHGFLVPVFALVLLWLRREMLPRVIAANRWGWALIALGGVLRWGSAYGGFALLDPLSLVPCLAGIALVVGGTATLRWAAPSILFLCFMIPLPGSVAGMLSQPLQSICTVVSTYILQTLGLPAIAQGNVIVLRDSQLGVAEACSGLRMTILFFAVCFGAAVVVKRPRLDKAILVASAVPIALAANVVRITLTGILYETAGHAWGDMVFHDLAGWFMMPLAVLMLWGELALVSRIVVPGNPTLASARELAPAHAASPTRSQRRRRRSL